MVNMYMYVCVYIGYKAFLSTPTTHVRQELISVFNLVCFEIIIRRARPHDSKAPADNKHCDY